MVKIINKKKFDKVALDKKVKIFIIYIMSFSLEFKMIIDLI